MKLAVSKTRFEWPDGVFEVHAAGVSNVGRYHDRKGASNQDDFCLVRGTKQVQDGFRWEPLFVLCDGMGGTAGGRTASRTTIDAVNAVIKEAVRLGLSPPQTPCEAQQWFAEKVIPAAQIALAAKIAAAPNLKDMGTTFAGLKVLPGGLGICCHVGDSRIGD